MPGPLLHVAAVGMCPHGGQIQIISSDARVMVNGMSVATMADQFLIVGCAFTVPPGKPQPCMRVQWMVPAARVLANSQPAILQTSVGICMSADGIPAGPPVFTTVQPRAIGS
ncbi:MAG: hypothetical protein ABSE56_05370 [Bryobacteraceae bacterium]